MVVPLLGDVLSTLEELTGVDDEPVLDTPPLEGVGAGAGVAGEEVVGSGVGAGAGVAGIVFEVLVFVDVLFEVSAKESGKAYCGKIKIAESKSGIKNFVFILPQLRHQVNKKL